jgi:hypothetical protein
VRGNETERGWRGMRGRDNSVVVVMGKELITVKNASTKTGRRRTRGKRRGRDEGQGTGKRRRKKGFSLLFCSPFASSFFSLSTFTGSAAAK